MIYGINEAGDKVVRLTGEINIPTYNRDIIDFMSESGSIWTLFNEKDYHKKYGIYIDGKNYFMKTSETAYAFVKRIGGMYMLNRQQIEYHNNKIVEAIDNL